MVKVDAIVLAAGKSTRMGQPKMLLPWRETTVLGQVVATLAIAGVEEIIAITGGAREPIEAEVVRLSAMYPVRTIFNPRYETEGMLSSIQAGLMVMKPSASAALIALGDQPQVRERTVRDIVRVFETRGDALVVPSCNKRRGHPVLIARPLWDEMLALQSPQTLRDFLNERDIKYVEADESVLMDLDTPEDYIRFRGS
jgi:molybdenum cofactor cytidylyltransferase